MTMLERSDVASPGTSRIGRPSPRGALRMWQRNATVGRRTLLTTLGPRFVEAIAYLAIMGLGLGAYLRSIDGVDYVTFIAPGVAAATVMFGATLETTYNAFVRIHVRRVVEAVATTPLSVADIVVGEYLWASTRAVAYGVVFLGVMAAFGLVASPLALLAPLVFVLGALTFSALGMSYTSFVSDIEHFNIFSTAVITPMFLFGGVFFPFDALPGWAQGSSSRMASSAVQFPASTFRPSRRASRKRWKAASLPGIRWWT